MRNLRQLRKQVSEFSYLAVEVYVLIELLKKLFLPVYF